MMVSFAVVAFAGPFLTMETKATKADSDKAKLFEPNPERALIYVFRDNAFLGKSLGTKVVVDNVNVANNEHNRFVVLSTPAGKHALMSLSSKESNLGASLIHNKNKTPVEIDAQAGSIYYVQEVFSPTGGFTMKVMTAEEAQPIIKKGTLLSVHQL
jgi:hypothetical protein